MENSKIKEESLEIIKDITRSGKVIEGTDVLNLVPEILSSVKLDKKYMMKCIKNELDSGGKNPLNALLGLMGMRIVHTQNTIKVLCEEFAGNSFSPDKSDSILKLDTVKLHKSVDHMADLISSIEQNNKDDHQKGISRQNELHAELNKRNNEYNQLFSDFKNQQKAVTERIQYMLCLCGENANDDPIKEQLTELLEDVDMEAYWNSENTQLSEQAMFTVLKCNEPEKRKTKPCIVHNGEVIIKGTKFISEG